MRPMIRREVEGRVMGRLQVMMVSLVILTTLVLQGLAAFELTVGPLERAPWMWPFMDYPMYNQPRYAGEPIDRQVVIGVLPDSSEVVVEPEDLDVTFWQFHSVLNQAIILGDRSRAEPYRLIYEDRRGIRLIGFRLEDRPFFVTGDGLEEADPSVLGALYFDADLP